MEERKLTATLKGVALMCLVGSGVIQREEDGSVNTEAFERFWEKFERNLSTAITNELNQIWEERQQSSDDGRYQSDGSLHKHIRSAFFFLAGLLFAILLK